jgi:hypothetical protein
VAGRLVRRGPRGRPASELVLDGESGFLVDDEREMGAAVERLCPPSRLS